MLPQIPVGTSDPPGLLTRSLESLQVASHIPPGSPTSGISFFGIFWGDAWTLVLCLFGQSPSEKKLKNEIPEVGDPGGDLALALMTEVSGSPISFAGRWLEVQTPSKEP